MEKRCPECKRILPENARFCKYCGYSVFSAEDAEDSLICSNCHTVNPVQANYCKKCGTRLVKRPPKNPYLQRIDSFDAFLSEELSSFDNSLGNNLEDVLEQAVSKAGIIKTRVLSEKSSVSEDAPQQYTSDFLKHLDSSEETAGSHLIDVCNRVSQSSKTISRHGYEGFEVLPKSEWGQATNLLQPLSSSVFIGQAQAVYHFLGQRFVVEKEQRLSLLNRNNLVIHYDESSAQDCMAFVSSITGRLLKGSRGKDFMVTVFDTQTYWGLGEPFDDLDERVYKVVSTPQGVRQELETLMTVTQNLIRNRLSPRRPTAELYNSSCSDKIANRLLILRNFPQDSVGNLDVLGRIMTDGARIGMSVILLVDDNYIVPEPSSRNFRDFNVDRWAPNSLIIDFVKGIYPSLPEGSSFMPEVLNLAELIWIVDEVNGCMGEIQRSNGIDVKDYLPDVARFCKIPPRMDISLDIGISRTFALQKLLLNDISFQSSLLVTGIRDSVPSIRNWMQALALLAITTYDPNGMDILMCDFSGDGCFAPFSDKLRNVFVPKSPVAKMITSFESKKRLLVFITGIGALDDKQLATLSEIPLKMKAGTHLIVEDVFSSLPFWEGQRMIFGPREEKGLSVSVQEFIYKGEICSCLTADMPTVNMILSSLLASHPEFAWAETDDNNFLNFGKKPENDVKDQTNMVIDAVNFNGRVFDGPLLIEDYLPKREDQWKQSAKKGLSIPIGINTWTDTEVSLKISRTDAKNSALIIGKTGTGKSSLLHTIILNSAYRYSPSELQMYLIDMSRVEFQFYAKSRLPHAAVIAHEAEREFAMSILDEIENEAGRRAGLFNREGINNYDDASGLARILVIIDEFHVLFDLDDDIRARAGNTIEKIVREYGKFGIHLILADQNLPPSSCLEYNQINNRVVFGCEPSDFTSLFGTSARQPALDKGECLYTSTNKLLTNMKENEVKSFFANAANCSISLVEALYAAHPECTVPQTTVFVRDREIFFGPDRISEPPVQEKFPEEVSLYIGEPIAVAEDTAITLDGNTYDNILILGGLQEVAQSIAINAVLSAGDTYEDGAADCFVMSFMKKKSILFGSAEAFLCGTPFSSKSKSVPREEFVQMLQQIYDEVVERQKDFSGEYRHMFLVFLDFQNSGIDRNVKKNLEFIMSNGPQVGIFSIMQANGVASLNERIKLGVFNHRIALQMSEDDSRDLIGKRWASALNDFNKEKTPGLQRAYYYNVNACRYVKFKPYSYRPLVLENNR